MTSSPILVVMGVSGAGKTTVGEAIAARLGWAFVDGDDLQPEANLAKMAGGQPLTDADRAPWLAAVKAWIDARLAAAEPGLITCSALKRSYRDFLVAGRPTVRILYLRADRATLESHLAHRTGHFMPPSLLQSQLNTLEEPAPDEHAITVQLRDTVEETVAEAAKDPIFQKR